MDINFAAANMAGYNNPKIEVFRAVLDDSGGGTLTQYPDKSIILKCLSRGSVPVIMLRYSTAGFLLLLSDWNTSETGTIINFTTPTGISSSIKIQITYPDSNDPPRIIIE